MQTKRTFAIFLICSLLLTINAATTLATEEGYTRTEYPTVVTPIIDGTWTSPDEWTDGAQTNITDNVNFRSTWTMVSSDPIVVTSNFIVEILNDNTDDAGDYWQICIDGNVDGGTAPQSDDFKIDIIGHTDITVYQGTGTGWTEVTPAEGDITYANSISESPTSSTPHWIAEFTFLKTSGVIQMGAEWALRVAVYDESNSVAGVQAWPPTPEDVPNRYGLNTYVSEPIPENLSFIVLALLSSVAIVVTTLVFRKRTK